MKCALCGRVTVTEPWDGKWHCNEKLGGCGADLRAAAPAPVEVEPVEHQTNLFESVAAFNATGSPTGRVMHDAPATSVEAAQAVPAKAHRGLILEALRQMGADGATSVEVARILPPDRYGNAQNSNRAASRLGELWEHRSAAILRDRGICRLGDCYPHSKPHRIHRPTAPCLTHGRIKSRNGAAIWVAVGGDAEQT